jgi:hypothetical protein
MNNKEKQRKRYDNCSFSCVVKIVVSLVISIVKFRSHRYPEKRNMT